MSVCYRPEAAGSFQRSALGLTWASDLTRTEVRGHLEYMNTQHSCERERNVRIYSTNIPPASPKICTLQGISLHRNECDM